MPNPLFFVWNPLFDNCFQLFLVTMNKLFFRQLKHKIV